MKERLQVAGIVLLSAVMMVFLPVILLLEELARITRKIEDEDRFKPINPPNTSSTTARSELDDIVGFNTAPDPLMDRVLPVDECVHPYDPPASGPSNVLIIDPPHQQPYGMPG